MQVCVHTCRNRRLLLTTFPVYMIPCLCARTKKKEQNTTNTTVLFDCQCTSVTAGTENQKSCPTATPLRQAWWQEDNLFPEGTGQQWELMAAFALSVYIQRGARSTGNNVHVCGSELRGVAGVSAHLHQSVESTHKKRPQIKKSPHLTSRMPHSFSHNTASVFPPAPFVHIPRLCAEHCTSPSDE